MAVLVQGVEPGSPGAKAGFKPGYTLLTINGHEVNDVLDYRYYMTEPVLHVAFRTADGKFHTRRIHKKDEYDDLGLDFDTYLMDRQMHCANKCVFCFVDQLPKGLRSSLYFKDDDSRLSFFYGNYITLTNMRDHDIDRIIEMHISPVNISVHTMDPELRVKMMKNPKAGESLRYLYRLAEAEVPLHTQLVLCPGINDGKALAYTLEELGRLRPSVQSIACVPLGVTRFREGLPELTTYTPQTAAETLDLINGYGRRFKEQYGTRLVYASDEFYIMAGRELPDAGYYEGYPQLDNGVGLCRSFLDEVDEVLHAPEDFGLTRSESRRRISAACGTAAYPIIASSCRKIHDVLGGPEVHVYPIENNFFGTTVTVSGLLTGTDLVEQLKGKDLGDLLLIPPTMVRTTYPQDGSPDDLMLDGKTIEECEQLLSVPIRLSGRDGIEFVKTILKEEN